MRGLAVAQRGLYRDERVAGKIPATTRDPLNIVDGGDRRGDTAAFGTGRRRVFGDTLRSGNSQQPLPLPALPPLPPVPLVGDAAGDLPLPLRLDGDDEDEEDDDDDEEEDDEDEDAALP